MADCVNFQWCEDIADSSTPENSTCSEISPYMALCVKQRWCNDFPADSSPGSTARHSWIKRHRSEYEVSKSGQVRTTSKSN